MIKMYLIILLSTVNCPSFDVFLDNKPDYVCEQQAMVSFTMARDEAIRALSEDRATVYQISAHTPYRLYRFNVRRLKRGTPKYEIDSSSIAIRGK